MEHTQDRMIHAFVHWAQLMFRDRGEMFSSAPDVKGNVNTPAPCVPTLCLVFLISITSPSLLCSSVHLFSPSLLVWVPVVNPYLLSWSQFFVMILTFLIPCLGLITPFKGYSYKSWILVFFSLWPLHPGCSLNSIFRAFSSLNSIFRTELWEAACFGT